MSQGAVFLHTVSITSVQKNHSTILEIENSQYLRNHSTNRDEILRQQADYGYRPCGMFKFVYFSKATWRTAAILEIENSPQPSTDRNKILHKHADCGCKPCGKLNLAYFRNSRWRRAFEMGF